jgi:hypothetical protein
MRIALCLSFMFALASGGAAQGEVLCSYDDKSLPRVAEPLSCSSFRGISLASTPQDVKQIARSLGFDVDTMYYVGSQSVVSGVNIYRGWEQIGAVSFDRSGRVPRLSLKDRFFCKKPVFVRRFVEELFERYDVKPIKEKDDVCFQDITCFKGISRFDEQFLILRIGTAAELYARPSRNSQFSCGNPATVN